MNPSLVRLAVGPLLAVFGSAAILLVDLSPKISVGGSLKPLSLGYSFLLRLLALRCCRITSNFLINKLYAKGYLPPYAEQVA